MANRPTPRPTRLRITLRTQGLSRQPVRLQAEVRQKSSHRRRSAPRHLMMSQARQPWVVRLAPTAGRRSSPATRPAVRPRGLLTSGRSPSEPSSSTPSCSTVAPWCDEDRFLPSVHRYLQATAREQLAHEALMTSTKLSPRLLETATAAARLAWQMGDQLGLTPAGHARLKLVVAGATHAEATLADLAAQGREILARRQAGQADPGSARRRARRRGHRMTDALQPLDVHGRTRPRGRPNVGRRRGRLAAEPTPRPSSIPTDRAGTT